MKKLTKEQKMNFLEVSEMILNLYNDGKQIYIQFIPTNGLVSIRHFDKSVGTIEELFDFCEFDKMKEYVGMISKSLPDNRL